jgi:hypothetical protein
MMKQFRMRGTGKRDLKGVRTLTLKLTKKAIEG